MPTRRTRADGDISRARILEAATTLVAEHGYEGTTIKAVIEASGLPSSSVYWHFRNKDALMAAVIESDYQQWATSWQLDSDNAGLDGATRLAQAAERTAAVMRDAPVFLQLGMRLIMERKPSLPLARAAFLTAREHATTEVVATLRQAAPELPEAKAKALAAYAVSGADGLYIRNLIDPDEDITDLFVMHGLALFNAAQDLIT